VREHRHRLRVIYGDTDQMGVVYYANYFRFFEAGRNELMRAARVPYRGVETSGFGFPVVEAHADYKSPSRYDDELELITIVAEVRRSSIRIEYLLHRVEDEKLIATGYTRHACLGPDGRLARLPPEVVEAFAPEPDLESES
jgi:acyl-CoA thioester hydrolase